MGMRRGTWKKSRGFGLCEKYGPEDGSVKAQNNGRCWLLCFKLRRETLEIFGLYKEKRWRLQGDSTPRRRRERAENWAVAGKYMSLGL